MDRVPPHRVPGIHSWSGNAAERGNYIECHIFLPMRSDRHDLFSFLHSFGFSEDELNDAFYLTDSFRSIPGTTLRRYMNRTVGSIEVEGRPAFLKGIILGLAIRQAVEALQEPPETDEEKQIDSEIERLRLGR